MALILTCIFNRRRLNLEKWKRDHRVLQQFVCHSSRECSECYMYSNHMLFNADELMPWKLKLLFMRCRFSCNVRLRHTANHASMTDLQLPHCQCYLLPISSRSTCTTMRCQLWLFSCQLCNDQAVLYGQIRDLYDLFIPLWYVFQLKVK